MALFGTILIQNAFIGLLGLAGKDNLEKARCDVIVDSFKDIRVECKPVTPIYMTETDEAKIVSVSKARIPKLSDFALTIL